MGRVPIPEGEIEGVLINSSNKGLQIQLGTRLQRHQVLRLLLPLTGQKTSAPTLGEVCWIKKKIMEKEGFLAGVRYLL